ncbi:MAG: pitrilysin family protein [Bryobacteraceae bacterium]
MRRAICFAVFAAALAMVSSRTCLAQAAASASETPAAPQRKDPIVVREVGPLPSWKNLKFPPLGKVHIPKPEIFTLSNGLKVYLLEDHELPLVDGRVLVRTGNLFDPKGKLGLAEMTGMVLRSGGTRTLTGEALDEKLENMAASIESSILESTGSAGFSCLKDNTDTVLGLFYDVLTDPAFREDKLNLAKTQIKSSISRRNDDASAIAQRELYRIVYGPHTPYGDEEEYDTINAVTRDDVIAFYKRYYFPANLILSVYGDFDSAAMKQRIETLFGAWKAEEPKVPPFPKVDAKPDPGIFLVSKSDVTQTFIQMGHLGGELRDKDFAALEVAADVLGGGFSGRLFREIRTRLGYAYEVGADWGVNYDHPGVFNISVSTKAQTTTETLKEIFKVLDGIRTSEITDDELKVAKDTVLNSLVFAFERPQSTLNRLITYDYFNYPPDFLTQYEKAISLVTKEDVVRVAKEHFQPSKLSIIAVGNEKNFGEPLTALNLPVKPLDVSIPAPHEATVTANAQTLAGGRELISKAVEFLGGAEKLKSIHDVTAVEDAQMHTPQGEMAMKVKSEGILPGTFREEQQRGPVTITLFVDGNSGWVNTPRGTQELPADAQQQIRSQVSRQLTSLLPQLANESNAVLTGDGKVQIKTADGNPVTFAIDPASGLIKSLSYAEEGGAVVENFSDWRDVGGIKLPFKSEVIKDGKPVQTAVASEIKINTNLNAEELGKRP